MKKVTYFFLLVLISFGTSFAQDDVLNQLMEHVSSANYWGLSELSSDFVEIETDKYEETTSKSQVGFVFKEFFKHHPPSIFLYSHIGTSPGGAKYAIASYSSKKGTRFLVVVKFKPYAGRLLIDTIKFTPER